MELFDLFFSAPPGLETTLAEEAASLGFAPVTVVPGGVETRGDWPAVWRANLLLRGAGRVLIRFASFRAMHLAQLDKRARKLAWRDFLHEGCAVRVEMTCRRSRIYHDRAARQRVEQAVVAALGATVAGADDPDAFRVMGRIEDDLVTLSIDSSGAPLHKRGSKTSVGKAPMRETLAALFLRQMGYDGQEPVLDPMCGSGTFVIEAAEIATGLAPGRARRFAFEALAGFDIAAWDAMKARHDPHETALRFYGSDRDDGAIRAATGNAKAAGVSDVTRFHRAAISDLERPEGPPGIVMVNPPYGARIGNRKLLFALYGTLGAVLKERFAGWRVGIVTSDGGLAKATGLPFDKPGPPIAHGGLTVKLYKTAALR
ncbi:class I SAM-dependent RNA methyltransferase [Cognatishimia sp. F0-27]|uniref:THUMP domain-containing class I SAM-dependent RNA methyltransferase n=1 Tax=Cognatishimia sp. F0-27 TaxID=2816855 RepID=UPI001D0CDB70|nr:class I SAM-dependent RNA methyltransferase [Cognatishimia sp. F0-27]MCC1492232.1 class I SAM-dependent RNA methyltransferase [Cognatishimia sp. F0-27]